MRDSRRRWPAKFFSRLAITLASVSLLAVSAGTDEVAAQAPSDDVLQERVEDALQGGRDLPADNISVRVTNGTVTLIADDLCRGEDCPGQGTPGGMWTVQQHIGAQVRAVPGVKSVEFSLGLEITPSGVEPPPIVYKLSPKATLTTLSQELEAWVIARADDELRAHVASGPE